MSQDRANLYSTWLQALKWISACVSAYWVSLSLSVQTLLILMALYYLAWLVVKFQRREVCCVGKKCTEEGVKVITTRVLILILVMATGVVGRLAKLPLDAASGMAMIFAVNEAIAIAGLCNQAGVKIPKALMEVLVRARGEAGRALEQGELKELTREGEGEGEGERGTARQWRKRKQQERLERLENRESESEKRRHAD